MGMRLVLVILLLGATLMLPVALGGDEDGPEGDGEGGKTARDWALPQPSPWA